MSRSGLFCVHVSPVYIVLGRVWHYNFLFHMLYLHMCAMVKAVEYGYECGKLEYELQSLSTRVSSHYRLKD